MLLRLHLVCTSSNGMRRVSIIWQFNFGRKLLTDSPFQARIRQPLLLGLNIQILACHLGRASGSANKLYLVVKKNGGDT
jgi:hypothetical protein